ncbi:MAG: multicopper oxidase domain-containing protein, partial [Rhizobacter sp.]|nr:multicopper oxidase domain-containing protein [Rhizobacter sp.]
MHSRRSFLAYTGGTTLTLFTYGKFGVKEAVAAIPGGTLDPAIVPKYQTPMLVPPAMPRAGVLGTPEGPVDYYEISMRQFQQQILPPKDTIGRDLNPTTVWGYGPAKRLNRNAPEIWNAPSLTIEANAGRPVRIKWINELKDANGNHLPHLLPVDPTLHWANPPGGTAGRDTRPTFDSTPGPYTGPVPMVTHVHGAVGVGDESDGYAEAWFLPDANNLPTEFPDYAREGTWYGFFKMKAKAKFGVDWGPGYSVSQYPNSGRASTDWYHDHTLGMTRLNVYAGPAGFYNIRGGPDGDRAVRRLVRGRERLALLPGPAPMEEAQNNPNRTYYDIPIAIQDRSFNADGSLWQIANEGGFLAAPVNLTGDNVEPNKNRLLMGLAERADLIFDFGNVPIGTNILLGNVGPDEPFGGGVPGTDFDPSDPATTGQIMQFRVGPLRSNDYSTPPAELILPAITPLPAPSVTRRLALIEEAGLGKDANGVDVEGPVEALLGRINGDPSTGLVAWEKKLWGDLVTENPALGAVEVWEIYNTTGDAHPMHVHETVFEVVNRQAILVFEDETNGGGWVQIPPTSPARGPEPW